MWKIDPTDLIILGMYFGLLFYFLIRSKIKRIQIHPEDSDLNLIYFLYVIYIVVLNMADLLGMIILLIGGLGFLITMQYRFSNHKCEYCHKDIISHEKYYTEHYYDLSVKHTKYYCLSCWKTYLENHIHQEIPLTQK